MDHVKKRSVSMFTSVIKRVANFTLNDIDKPIISTVYCARILLFFQKPHKRRTGCMQGYFMSHFLSLGSGGCIRNNILSEFIH